MKYIFVFEFLKKLATSQKIMFHIFFINKVHICIQAKKKKSDSRSFDNWNELSFFVGHIESSGGSSGQREVYTACTWRRQGHSVVCGLLCSMVWSLPTASPTVEETGQGTIITVISGVRQTTGFFFVELDLKTKN